MKIRESILTGLILTGILISGCERNDTSTKTATLKQSVKQSAEELYAAIAAIGSSKAFNLLTVSEDDSKSVSGDSVYKVYINLDQIKGIYEYKPVTITDRWGLSLIHYFTRTADDRCCCRNC